MLRLLKTRCERAQLQRRQLAAVGPTPRREVLVLARVLSVSQRLKGRLLEMAGAAEVRWRNC